MSTDDPDRRLALGLDERTRPAWRAPAPDELPTIPNLQVGELIGAGGMGAVYRARQTHVERPVAWKLLDPARSSEPGFTERFAREARVLARLDHPGIVRVYDTGSTEGLCWLVMELVEGADLRQLMRTGGLAPEEVLRLMGEVCRALEHAHKAGVVHRDLKPENILIDEHGRPRLVDFGLARLVDEERVTASGTGCGSVHYMAPEQVVGGSIDHRADIYALGVICYELLTGQLPLGRFTPPSQAAGVDSRLDAVVHRCLERDPDKRWPSAEALAAALGVVTEGAPATDGGDELPDWVRIMHCGRSTKGLQRYTRVGGFVMVLMLVMGGLLWALPAWDRFLLLFSCAPLAAVPLGMLEVILCKWAARIAIEHGRPDPRLEWSTDIPAALMFFCLFTVLWALLILALLPLREATHETFYGAADDTDKDKGVTSTMEVVRQRVDSKTTYDFEHGLAVCIEQYAGGTRVRYTSFPLGGDAPEREEVEVSLPGGGSVCFTPKPTGGFSISYAGGAVNVQLIPYEPEDWQEEWGGIPEGWTVDPAADEERGAEPVF